MGLRKFLRKRSESQKNSHQDDPIKSSGHKNTFREEISDSESTAVEEKDTLAIMYTIIMQIRNDPEYASSIYANCPRLQHLLEQRPDLRPIFEDPRFVRINFEDVFRKEGGVLPEDEPKKTRKPPSRLTRCVVCVVQHPLFKVLRVLLLIKKLIGCIFGGGFALVSGIVTGCFCESAADLAADSDVDGDRMDADADAEAREQEIHERHQANREALNKAADHLEDPEVQAQMEELMQMEPDQFAEAIEKDDDLRALRDSSPVCAELMSDPETMRIVCDPDNLRALGEAPELVEMDFADPDWTPPEGDLETGGNPVEADVDTGANQEDTIEFELENTNVDDGADIEEGNTYEIEQPDCDAAEEFELGQTHQGSSTRNTKDNNNENQNQNQEGFRTIFAQVGAGISDIVASELVGFSFREVTGGGDDGLGGITEVAGGADTSDVEKAVDLNDIDDHIDNVEDVMDEAEDAHDTSTSAAAPRNGSGNSSRSQDENALGSENDFEEEDAPKDKKKKRLGAVRGFASKIRTAAKEYVAGAIFSEDLGEVIVEKMEEKKDNKNEEVKKGGTRGV